MQQERSFERRRNFAIKIHQSSHSILYLPLFTQDVLKINKITQINIDWPCLKKKVDLRENRHISLGVKTGVSMKDSPMLRPFEREKGKPQPF